MKMSNGNNAGIYRLQTCMAHLTVKIFTACEDFLFLTSKLFKSTQEGIHIHLHPRLP